MLKNFKIYVINLKREVERRKNIINQLKKQNLLDFEIIDAIDGEEINKSDLDLLISKNNKFINPINTNMNGPEICCSLSHIKVYKKFIETNMDYALIFEDDAVFLSDFSQKLQEFIIRNFNYEKQIILLGELWQFYKKPLDIENEYEIVDVRNAVFTHAYLINRKAAKSLISFNYPVKTMPDNFLLFNIYCGIKITGLNPFLVKQDKKNFESSIPRDNRLNQIFLLRVYIYKLINRILKIFHKSDSHKKKI
ncbi:glycosyltransferase family 25 protein [Candidatus Pelagibacter sp.]|nr:glycosyltransferase family 25 protein [Candidatus Pelagibacter sp.]